MDRLDKLGSTEFKKEVESKMELEEKQMLDIIKANDIVDHSKYLDDNKEKIALMKEELEQAKKLNNKNVYERCVTQSEPYQNTVEQVIKNNKYQEGQLEKEINFGKKQLKDLLDW